MRRKVFDAGWQVGDTLGEVFPYDTPQWFWLDWLYAHQR